MATERDPEKLAQSIEAGDILIAHGYRPSEAKTSFIPGTVASAPEFMKNMSTVATDLVQQLASQTEGWVSGTGHDFIRFNQDGSFADMAGLCRIKIVEDYTFYVVHWRVNESGEMAKEHWEVAEFLKLVREGNPPKVLDALIPKLPAVNLITGSAAADEFHGLPSTTEAAREHIRERQTGRIIIAYH